MEGMDQINKCTSVLRPLLTASETNGVILAENALNELVANTPRPRRIVALESVQSVVKAHRDTCSGTQRTFADTVNDYIEKLVRDHA
jgi:hypothetical protein